MKLSKFEEWSWGQVIVTILLVWFITCLLYTWAADGGKLALIISLVTFPFIIACTIGAYVAHEILHEQDNPPIRAQWAARRRNLALGLVVFTFSLPIILRVTALIAEKLNWPAEHIYGLRYWSILMVMAVTAFLWGMSEIIRTLDRNANR